MAGFLKIFGGGKNKTKKGSYATDIGGPVQLVQPNDEKVGDKGGFELNRDALRDIFGDSKVVDKPIAVVSLTGGFRKGKSFLLNLFLNRLRSEKPENWVKDKSRLLLPEDGFHWRGGHVSDTKGIWMWSKPFPFTTSDGKEGNLFLMDTQGAFDLVSNTKSASVVFALSTLISSVQIYNVSQNIGGDDLQSLQVFADFGNTVNEKARKNNESSDLTSFQNMIFLIRDWSFSNFECGSDGGNEYLEDILNKSENQEIIDIRENIKKFFSDLSCFLLPHPGKLVAGSGNKEAPISFKDIDREFLKHVNELQNKLFHPDNIVLKQNNGFDCTGNDLIDLVQLYFDVFESGKLPPVETWFEADQKMKLVSLMKKLKKQYVQSMKEKCTHYLEDLKTVHEECKLEALQSFEKSPLLSQNPTFLQEGKKHLTEKIEKKLKDFSQKNIVFEKELKQKLSNIVMEMSKIAKSEIEQKSGGEYVEDNSLELIINETRQIVLDQFQEKVESIEVKKLIEEFETILALEMARCFEDFTTTNEHREKELKRILSELSFSCKKVYHSEMNKNCNAAISDSAFDKAHTHAYKKSSAQFEKSEIGLNTQHRKNFEAKLYSELDNKRLEFKKINENNQKLAKEKTTMEVVNKAKEKYLKSLNNRCKDQYVNSTELDQTHLNCMEEALKVIKDSKISDELAQKCETQIGEIAVGLLKQFKGLNEDYKKNAENQLEKTKENAFTSYVDKIIEHMNGKFVEKNELQNFHDLSMAESLNQYEREAKKIQSQGINAIKTLLEEDITKQFLIFEKQNVFFESNLIREAEFALQKAKDAYMDQMNKITDTGYIDPNQLKQHHSEAKHDQQAKIEYQFSQQGFKNFGNRYANKCCRELDGCFKTIEQDNQNNNKPWYSRLGNAVKSGVVGLFSGVVEGFNR